MGWFRPDLFRRLITYSGTFVDQQADNAPEEKQFPLGAWEYHSGMKLIENTPKKPLRIFTHVSENDNGSKAPENGHHNWVMANQRTAAALKAKGYDYRFVFRFVRATVFRSKDTNRNLTIAVRCLDCVNDQIQHGVFDLGRVDRNGY